MQRECLPGQCSADHGREKGVSSEEQIAVWDVIASCEIEGSSDSSIRNVVPMICQ